MTPLATLRKPRYTKVMLTPRSTAAATMRSLGVVVAGVLPTTRHVSRR
jgi:hypothetical protein